MAWGETSPSCRSGRIYTLLAMHVVWGSHLDLDYLVSPCSKLEPDRELWRPKTGDKLCLANRLSNELNKLGGITAPKLPCPGPSASAPCHRYTSCTESERPFLPVTLLRLLPRAPICPRSIQVQNPPPTYSRKAHKLQWKRDTWVAKYIYLQSFTSVWNRI